MNRGSRNNRLGHSDMDPTISARALICRINYKSYQILTNFDQIQVPSLENSISTRTDVFRFR